MTYKLRTWRLPLAGRNARGKAIVNVLPVSSGVSIADMMPVDVPEEDWQKLQIVFATSDGDVRRNRLSDFTSVKSNGKIAMRLGDGGSVRLIGARIADENDDVMLVTARGRAIRFRTTDVRVFAGRDSTGVRGIRLAEGDEVVSMAVIRHFEASPEERAAYLKMRRAVAGAPPEDQAETSEEEESVADVALAEGRYAQMSAAEELILTVTERGLGKLSSSHDYPVRGRGGQGVQAIDKGRRGGRVVASFPVNEDDQVMLVTDRGQSIRCGVSGISFRSRAAGGVRVLNTAADESVVSVAWIAGQGEPDAE
jgi:DNA gyrase subunit A